MLKRYKEVISTAKFWVIYLGLTVFMAFNGYIMFSLKNIGLKYYSDSQMSTLSLITCVNTFFGALAFGILTDKVGISKILRILAIFAILNIFVFYYWKDNFLVFALTIAYIFFMASVAQSLQILLFILIYGADIALKLSGILFSAAMVSSFLV